MASDNCAAIREKFGGSWKVDRSEHFEEFLAQVGVNVVVRKMASLAKPTSQISVEGNTITITMNAGFMKKCDTFKLDEEYETDFQGTKTKCLARYEDGRLVIHSTPVNSAVKPTTATRELIDNENMLLTMTVGDVVCKRWFKKLTV